MNAPDWLLRQGGDAQVVAFFALFAALAALEVAWPAVARRELRRRWRTNLALTAINIVVLGALPLSLLAAALWSQDTGAGLLHHAPLPGWAIVLSSLLGRALISFVTHLMMHKVPLLWRLHRVHHLDDELDVSTTVRLHPMEFVVGLVPGVVITAGLGLLPWVVVLYEILDAAVTVFSHSNILLPRRLDAVLSPIVVTPNLHRVHHAAHLPATDSNFGAVFPIWDIVFGTFVRLEPAALRRLRLGLDEPGGGRRDGLIATLVEPIARREPHR